MKFSLILFLFVNLCFVNPIYSQIINQDSISINQDTTTVNSNKSIVNSFNHTIDKICNFIPYDLENYFVYLIAILIIYYFFFNASFTKRDNLQICPHCNKINKFLISSECEHSNCKKPLQRRKFLIWSIGTITILFLITISLLKYFGSVETINNLDTSFFSQVKYSHILVPFVLISFSFTPFLIDKKLWIFNFVVLSLVFGTYILNNYDLLLILATCVWFWAFNKFFSKIENYNSNLNLRNKLGNTPILRYLFMFFEFLFVISLIKSYLVDFSDNSYIIRSIFWFDNRYEGFHIITIFIIQLFYLSIKSFIDLLRDTDLMNRIKKAKIPNPSNPLDTIENIGIVVGIGTLAFFKRIFLAFSQYKLTALIVTPIVICYILIISYSQYFVLHSLNTFTHAILKVWFFPVGILGFNSLLIQFDFITIIQFFLAGIFYSIFIAANVFFFMNANLLKSHDFNEIKIIDKIVSYIKKIWELAKTTWTEIFNLINSVDDIIGYILICTVITTFFLVMIKNIIGFFDAENGYLTVLIIFFGAVAVFFRKYKNKGISI